MNMKLHSLVKESLLAIGIGAIGGQLLTATAVTADVFQPGSFFVGVNYWGSQDGVRMWNERRWKPDEVEKDLAALASNGVEVVRAFPTWPDFQPIRALKKCNSVPFGMAMGEDCRPLDNFAGVDDAAIGRFRFFCDAAARHGLKVLPSIVTGWMSGGLFAPEALQNKDLIADHEAVMWAARFARYFVRAMRDHPAIVAWDLGNEYACMADATHPAQVWVWIDAVAGAIRREDSTRPVLSGEHCMQSDVNNPCNLQTQGELLDILTPHPYPAPWRVDACRGHYNGFRNALHPSAQCLFYEGIAQKPAFPQEVGSLGPCMTPDRIAALGLRQQAFAVWMHGARGFLWWCAFDQLKLDYPPFSNNSVERELGILKPDSARTPKPQAKALAAFKAFRDSLPFRRLPPRQVDAVCLLSEKTDAWQTSFGAFMLAKEAGFDVIFTGAETGPLPEAKLYILPSEAGGWETYSNPAWKRVLNRVEKTGATLLVTRGGSTGYSEWARYTGLDQELWRQHADIDFELDGVRLHAEDDFTALQHPVGCRVLARDQKGRVVLSVRELGKGRVIVCNFALELRSMTSYSDVCDGSFSNELWRIYAHAAKTASIARCVTRDDVRLVLTEHPRADGATLVCALNTHEEDVAFPVDVKGVVGRVWNGTFSDGKLSIRGNDGCVFEVRSQGRRDE